MATKEVTSSSQNVADDAQNALWQMAAILNDLVTLTKELKTDFEAHNHAYDDGGATEYTSKPNDSATNAPTVSATTALTIAAADPDDIKFRELGTP